jgi:hypothetical protein
MMGSPSSSENEALVVYQGVCSPHNDHDRQGVSKLTGYLGNGRKQPDLNLRLPSWKGRRGRGQVTRCCALVLQRNPGKEVGPSD